MVQILNSCDCDCETCDGGKPAPKGIYGGSRCICRCHHDKRYRERRIAEKKRLLAEAVEKFKNKLP